MYSLRRTKDVGLVRSLHEKLFEGDAWVGDDHTFWVARDSEGLPVGFCSAIYRPQLGYVYLSRAGVDESARGAGLQRRMIRARVQWAKRLGAREVITYTLLRNYDSFVNLLKCGFRFYKPDAAYVGEQVHYMRIQF